MRPIQRHPCFQATQAALWTQMAFSEAVCGSEGLLRSLSNLSFSGIHNFVLEARSVSNINFLNPDGGGLLAFRAYASSPPQQALRGSLAGYNKP